MLGLLVHLGFSCKDAAKCENSSQCADGFACSAAGSCESLSTDMPDADLADGDVPDSGGAAACPSDTHQCIAPPPVDWSGPVARTSASAPNVPISCATNYSQEVLDVFSGLQATGDCSCACSGTASGTACSNSSTIGFNQSSCQALAGGTTTVILGGCSESPAQSQASYRWGPSSVTGAGSCASPSVDDTIVPAFFAQEERFCESVDTPAGSCSGSDSCLPVTDSGFENELCIYQEGDQTCPVSTYTEKFTRFVGVNDDRSCGACNCNGPSNGTVCANVTVRPSTNSECFNGIGAPISANSCVSGNFPTAFSTTSTDLRPFGCTASGGGVVGAATETGLMTFCCQAP